ncbi:MAG: GAF domain-containing protein [Deltaproteobacteria bacterium]|nr:GAF domain-containing protein [Deltaproteobacteria bacterium]
MPSANAADGSNGWAAFPGLWERANLVRAFLWHQQYSNPQALLNQFLVRLRRFYSVDFCFGGLLTEAGELVDAAVPLAGLDRLPTDFARRCLDLVAHSRAPVTWNEVNAEFGFHNLVLAPIVPPLGAPLGFLMLGHGQRRGYSAADLFALQSLASELSWAAREVQGKVNHHHETAELSNSVKKTLQLINSSTGLIRQNLGAALSREQERFFINIEAGIDELLARLNRLPEVLEADENDFALANAPAAESADAEDEPQ